MCCPGLRWPPHGSAHTQSQCLWQPISLLKVWYDRPASSAVGNSSCTTCVKQAWLVPCQWAMHATYTAGQQGQQGAEPTLDAAGCCCRVTHWHQRHHDPSLPQPLQKGPALTRWEAPLHCTDQHGLESSGLCLIPHTLTKPNSRQQKTQHRRMLTRNSSQMAAVCVCVCQEAQQQSSNLVVP